MQNKNGYSHLCKGYALLHLTLYKTDQQIRYIFMPVQMVSVVVVYRNSHPHPTQVPLLNNGVTCGRGKMTSA